MIIIANLLLRKKVERRPEEIIHSVNTEDERLLRCPKDPRVNSDNEEDDKHDLVKQVYVEDGSLFAYYCDTCGQDYTRSDLKMEQSQSKLKQGYEDSLAKEARKMFDNF